MAIADPLQRAAVVMLVTLGVTGAAKSLRARDARAEAATLRASAQRLVDRGELGEALEVAERAAVLAPAEKDSWAMLAALRAIAQHDGGETARREP